MSELKRALQKAKEENKLSWAATEDTSAPAAPPFVTPLSRPMSHKKEPPPNSVEVLAPSYRQTRCIEASSEELVDRKLFSILEKSPIADQYKVLRTKILNIARPNGYRTIEVTSFKEGDGKTLTAVNLAITLAKEPRQNVLLVDMDLRRPNAHELLGVPATPGLKDYILDQVPLDEIMIHPGIERLTFIPAGGRLDNSSELIGSHRFANLLRELRERYQDRYILFDTPALCSCSDPLVLSSYVDAVLLVARAGYTTTEDIAAGMANLGNQKVLGVVLNDSQISKGSAY